MCVVLFFPLRPVLYSYRGGRAENRAEGGGSMDQHTVVHVPADAKWQIALPGSGSFDVTVTVGDPCYAGKKGCKLGVNGTRRNVPETAAGRFADVTFTEVRPRDGIVTVHTVYPAGSGSRKGDMLRFSSVRIRPSVRQKEVDGRRRDEMWWG